MICGGIQQVVRKRESGKFKIYYILKERGGMKLLSSTDNLSTDNIVAK